MERRKSRNFEGVEYPLRSYIVLEGIIGAGKTTQIKLLETYLTRELHEKRILVTHEPGDSEIADKIRSVVQVMRFKEEMTGLCEAYLYAASRAQTLPTKVGPALAEGKIVLADRSVITSGSYQGFGRRLGLKTIIEINKKAVDQYWPSKGIFIDTPLEIAMGRAQDKLGDKFESFGRDFFELAREGYLVMAQRNPEVVTIVDGAGDENEVHERVRIKAREFLRDELLVG